MMLTTGILMFGKMSVGVRTIASPPIIKMSIDTTTKVYGRLSASLTIHIIHPSGLAGLHPSNQPTACVSESWHPGSRSMARLLEAQRPFVTEQYCSQESSFRRRGGCRRCPAGLWSLEGDSAKQAAGA